MKQVLHLRPSAPPLTLEDQRARIAGVEGQIAAKQAELKRLQRLLPGIIAAHLGSDLAAVKERAELRALKDFLDDLYRTREVLLVQYQDAEQAEHDAELLAAFKESEAAGDLLAAEVKELQKDIERAVVRILAVRKLDAEFCNKLRGDPSGFDRRSFSVLLPRHIEIAQYSLSDGEVSARGIIDSPFQIRQAGRHDLFNLVLDYIAVGLRGAHVPQPPPQQL